MKIALITDTHWGVRNDNLAFADYFKKFYDNIFFPELDKRGIKNIIHLGDITDRRKYINWMTAKRLRDDFITPIMKNNMSLDVIIGNHDTYFKNTNDVNSMNELYGNVNYSDINVISDPTTKTYDGLDIVLMPWINTGNFKDSVGYITDTHAQVMFGHFEIKGFEMYRGAVNDHGFDHNLFDKFDLVASGHFHHKSTQGNINYLGAPYEMTWSDYDDMRGFHIFDTDTRELEFIRNPYNMFHKVWYDDLNKTVDEVVVNDFRSLSGTYVKVIIKNKTNPYWFDMFIDKIEQVSPIDLQVVEDHLNLDLEDDSDIVNEAEDTMTILKKYVDQLELSCNKKKLDLLMRDLYNEALSIE